MPLINLAHRYHDIDCGHRVVGHEGKCRHFHGHTYRFHFFCKHRNFEFVNLDDIGRVVDFGVIKSTLCQWLEDNWDHKFLMWEADPYWNLIFETIGTNEAVKDFRESFVRVPFNPTAENIGNHIITQVAPKLLAGTGCFLHTVQVEETRKCSAFSIWED